MQLNFPGQLTFLGLIGGAFLDHTFLVPFQAFQEDILGPGHNHHGIFIPQQHSTCIEPCVIKKTYPQACESFQIFPKSHNLIDEKILTFEILNGLSIYGGVFKCDSTGSRGLVVDYLVDAFSEVKIKIRLVFSIEVCVYLLC